MSKRKELTPVSQQALLEILRVRFEKNMVRHQGLDWHTVMAWLSPESLWKLNEMERTGGEPDVIAKERGDFFFCDCSAESPSGRRSLCYDREGLDSRKEHKPANNAVDMAAVMGIQLMPEERYRDLQQVGRFDVKTSSWLKTPDAMRELGGALFGDRRYDRVFIYHNGAQSYYAARGFRGLLRL